ncbi:Nephrocystin-3, partial [Exaiptasia diaphana]
LQSLHPTEVTHVYLSGNPGCGKSETARQVGEKFFDETESASSKTFVATLNASSLESLLKSYIDFARQLRVDEEYIQNILSSKTHSQPEDKIWQLKGLVNQKLTFFSSWLIIIDNVVSLKKVSKFFPHFGEKTTAKAQVLVTTQDGPSIPLPSPNFYHKSLSEGMKPEDAVNALCTISHQFQDKDVVFEIAKALDYQPLALACTAVYMKSVCNQPWSSCLQKIYEGKREKTEKQYLETNSQVYSQTMTTAVKMALDRVVTEDEVMMFALQMLSVVAQDPIPIKYVVQYVLLCMPDEDEEFIEAHIARSSLILKSDDDQYVRVHQVVHAVLQDTVRHTVEGDCLRVAKLIKSFSQLAINDIEEPDYDFIMSIKSLTSHFVTLKEVISPNLQPFMALTKKEALCVSKCLSCCIGKVCYMNGQLKAARSYLEMSIALKEHFCSGERHLIERNTLGEILYDLQDFRKSKLCFEQALPSHHYQSINKKSGLDWRVLTNLWLTLSKKEVGEYQKAESCLNEALPYIAKLIHHADIQYAGKILNNIAMVHFYLENYAEAKKFMEEALTMDKEKYGANHPFVSEKYNDLALVLKAVGEHKTAVEYLQTAVQIGKSCYEEKHPYLSTYLGNLGNVFRELGEYEEAKKHIEEAIAIDEYIYDENNPALAIDLNNLALVFRDLRQYKEAKTRMERAIAIDKVIYEENHPTLAKHLDNFGLVLLDLGQYEEAIKCTKKAFAIGMYLLRDLGQLEEVDKCMDRALGLDELGDNHPALAIDFISIGLVLRDLRRYEEAKKCMERALGIDERIYDDNHPTLATHLNSLGLVLQDLRQYEEAKKCMERALAIDERIYDDNHPTLAIHLHNLGLVLQDLRQNEEAKKCMKRGVAIAERIYDDNHPDLAKHLNNLAMVLKDLRQNEEAKECMERAVAIDERIYDDNHPTLAIHLNNLGLVLQELRQNEEAKKCMKRAVAIDEHIYDDNHPELAKHFNNLAMVLKDLRQYEEAKKCMERAVAIAEQLAIYLNNLGMVLRDLRQYEEAKKCMERAVAIAERMYDDNHPNRTLFVQNMYDLRKQTEGTNLHPTLQNLQELDVLVYMPLD